MPDTSPEKGDKVSWDWGGSAPSGEVSAKKTEGKAQVKSKRGNVIEKNASKDDPALEISRSGNDVVKNESEVKVNSKGSKSQKKKDDEKKDDKKEEDQSTEKKEEEEKEKPKADDKAKSPANGAKRAREADDDEEKAEKEEKPAKKGKAAAKKDDSKAKDSKSKKDDDVEAKDGKEDKSADKRKAGRPKTDSKVRPAKNLLPNRQSRSRERSTKDEQAKGATKKSEKKAPTPGTRRSSRLQGK